LIANAAIKVPFEAAMRRAVSSVGRVGETNVTVHLTSGRYINSEVLVTPPPAESAPVLARLEAGQEVIREMATAEVFEIPYLGTVRYGDYGIEVEVTKAVPFTTTTADPRLAVPAILPSMPIPMGPGPWKAFYPTTTAAAPVVTTTPRPPILPNEMQAPVAGARKLWIKQEISRPQASQVQRSRGVLRGRSTVVAEDVDREISPTPAAPAPAMWFAAAPAPPPPTVLDLGPIPGGILPGVEYNLDLKKYQAAREHLHFGEGILAEADATNNATRKNFQEFVNLVGSEITSWDKEFQVGQLPRPPTAPPEAVWVEPGFGMTPAPPLPAGMPGVPGVSGMPPAAPGMPAVAGMPLPLAVPVPAPAPATPCVQQQPGMPPAAPGLPTWAPPETPPGPGMLGMPPGMPAPPPVMSPGMPPGMPPAQPGVMPAAPPYGR